MKHLENFSDWAGQPFTITTQDFLNEYRECLNCTKLYKIFKPKTPLCRYCGSKDYKMLDEPTYYSKLKLQIDDPKEWENIKKEREIERETFIDFGYVNQKNIN